MSGWNGSDRRGVSTPVQPKVTAKKPSPIRGLVAGGLVIILAAVAYFAFFSGSEKPQSDEVGKKPAKIKEVTPAAAPTNAVAKADEKPKRLTKKGTPIPDKVQPDEKGILRYPNGQRWVDPNDLHIVEHPKPKLLFKHTSENQIAVMLRLDPTRMAPFLIGKRRPYDERFVKDFKESLKETPLVIDKEDTPEEAELRKAVIETKMELRDRMEAGEDIAKIMNDTQKELDRLCQYHDDLKKEIREAMNNPELSDADVEDYVKAANQLLEKQGIKQFTMPKLINRQARLLMMKERRAKLEAQKKAEAQNAEAQKGAN